MKLTHQYTLVTGASAGLGREIARTIARDHRGDLVLTARRKDRLDELAEELIKAYSVRVVTIKADLSIAEQADECLTQATDGRDVAAAILNAGVTYCGPAIDQSAQSAHELIATNVAAVVRLATGFARYRLQKEGGGTILLVSSMAGFAPMPYQAVYGGTKAFVTSFGQALGQELSPQGVSVKVFCPGGINTEMLELSGLSRQFGGNDFGIMDAPTCGRLAVEALVGDQNLVVPGATNRLAALAMRALPRGLVVPAIERMYRGALKKDSQ